MLAFMTQRAAAAPLPTDNCQGPALSAGFDDYDISPAAADCEQTITNSWGGMEDRPLSLPHLAPPLAVTDGMWRSEDACDFRDQNLESASLVCDDSEGREPMPVITGTVGDFDLYPDEFDDGDAMELMGGPSAMPLSAAEDVLDAMGSGSLSALCQPPARWQIIPPSAIRRVVLARRSGRRVSISGSDDDIAIVDASMIVNRGSGDQSSSSSDDSDVDDAPRRQPLSIIADKPIAQAGPTSVPANTDVNIAADLTEKWLRWSSLQLEHFSSSLSRIKHQLFRVMGLFAFWAYLHNLYYLLPYFCLVWFAHNTISQTAFHKIARVLSVVLVQIFGESLKLPLDVPTILKRFPRLQRYCRVDYKIFCPSCYTTYPADQCQHIDSDDGTVSSVICTHIEFPKHPHARYRVPCNVPLMGNKKTKLQLNRVETTLSALNDQVFVYLGAFCNNVTCAMTRLSYNIYNVEQES